MALRTKNKKTQTSQQQGNCYKTLSTTIIKVHPLSTERNTLHGHESNNFPPSYETQFLSAIMHALLPLLPISPLLEFC